jgi:hypothetical protein
MGILKIECDTGNVSDGFHTFNELYEHRCVLFAALMKTHPDMSWRARKHDDGSCFEGWFIAGMHLPTGDITYHLPDKMWELFDNAGIETLDKAPLWDKHTSRDVIKRIEDWAAMIHSRQ